MLFGVLRSGQALSVHFNASGRPEQTGVTDTLVSGDDYLIRNAPVANPYSGGAQVMFGPDFTTPLDFDAAIIATRQMVLVRVFYTGTTSDGSFVALRVSHVACFA